MKTSLNYIMHHAKSKAAKIAIGTRAKIPFCFYLINLGFELIQFF